MADSPGVDIAGIISKLAPIFLGSGTTTTRGSDTSSVDTSPTALAENQAVFSTALNNANNPDITDAVTQNILHNAALAFAPVLGEERSSGLYNSTVKQQLASEAQARATAEASQAALNFRTSQEQIANAAAGQLTASTKRATSTNSQAQRTSPVIPGKTSAATLLSGASALLGVPKAIKAAKDLFGSGTSANDVSGFKPGENPELSGQNLTPDQLTDFASNPDNANVFSGNAIGSEGQFGDAAIGGQVDTASLAPADIATIADPVDVAATTGSAGAETVATTAAETAATDIGTTGAAAAAETGAATAADAAAAAPADAVVPSDTALTGNFSGPELIAADLDLHGADAQLFGGTLFNTANTGSAFSLAGDLGGEAAINLGGDLGGLGTDAAINALDFTAGTAGDFALGAGAATAEDIGASFAADAAASTAADVGATVGLDAAATAGAEAAGAGGVDAAAEAALALLSVSCTELMKQGKIKRAYYHASMKAFAGYSNAARRAYWLWGIPAAKYIRRNPNRLLSRILSWFLTNRTEFIAAKAGINGAKKTFKGKLAQVVIATFTTVLGVATLQFLEPKHG